MYGLNKMINLDKHDVNDSDCLAWATINSRRIDSRKAQYRVESVSLFSTPRTSLFLFFGKHLFFLPRRNSLRPTVVTSRQHFTFVRGTGYNLNLSRFSMPRARLQWRVRVSVMFYSIAYGGSASLFRSYKKLLKSLLESGIFIPRKLFDISGSDANIINLVWSGFICSKHF